MPPVTTALHIALTRGRLPAWIVLDILQRQGYSEFETLTTLLLEVQCGSIQVDPRGRLSLQEGTLCSL